MDILGCLHSRCIVCDGLLGTVGIACTKLHFHVIQSCVYVLYCTQTLREEPCMCELHVHDVR
jgi:hypothetical protein